ncbi:hypothetical protein B0H17DRAFT_1085643, partial [Mycena rosella]
GHRTQKKSVTLDVNGKNKKDKKPTYTNADLPFPADGHAADLKHFQTAYIPDLIDWIGTLDDPFGASSHPEFTAQVERMWVKYFSAYDISDAVHAMAVAACGNWRSSIGKRGVKAVVEQLNKRKTVQGRRDWVAEQIKDLTFLYGDPETQGRSYRSDLIIRTFGAHLHIAMKTEESWGDPTGALSLCAAAVERALSLCRDGHLRTEGLPRKGKDTALSFVAVPWADRAASYLTPIKTLTLQKWSEIFSLGNVFKTDKGSVEDDIFNNSTDGDESSEASAYVDPRSRVVVSDDED